MERNPQFAKLRPKEKYILQRPCRDVAGMLHTCCRDAALCPLRKPRGKIIQTSGEKIIREERYETLSHIRKAQS